MRNSTTPHLYPFTLLTAVAFLVSGWASIGSAAPELTDQTIGDKIEDELRFDHGVPAERIDVSVDDGIAQLQGQVGNLLAKERAARIAETVKGVRAVVNQIEVRPPQSLTDQDVHRDVEAALAGNPATEAFELTVDIRQGIVTLGGTVDSYQERMLARQVAKGVKGVSGVNDEMVVITNRDRPEEELNREIEQVLRWDQYIDDSRITVNVSDGRVELRGVVGSLAEKRQAHVQAWVAGVESVDDSRLLVKGWARDERLRRNKFAVRSRQEIQSAIHDALAIDPRVDADNVRAEIAGSTVTLRGQVDNLTAKHAAESAARRTVGVNWVTNRLKVRPRMPKPDEEVAADIRAALMRDPYFERYKVVAAVVSGTAYLSGTVDSQFERQRAEEVASNIQDVIDIRNYLQVSGSDDFADMLDPYVNDGHVHEGRFFGNFERRVPGKSDAELKAAIESELWWSPYIDAQDVTVTVEKGIATLSGEVNSWRELQAATQNAYKGGATLVDNDIRIR